MSADEICPHLVGAIRCLRNIQRAAPEYRTRNLYALLALYDSGESDVSASEARRRSNLLRSTIRNDATCGIFLNIRLQLNPMDHPGLQYVNVPATLRIHL